MQRITMEKNDDDLATECELTAWEAALAERRAQQALVHYVEKVVISRLFADRARRAGDPNASPKDYECGCPLSRVDLLPICWGLRPTCRFRRRPRPDGARIWDNAVRHRAFKTEFPKFIERMKKMSDVERSRLVDKIMRLDAQRRKTVDHAQHAPKSDPRDFAPGAEKTTRTNYCAAQGTVHPATN